jgi:aspartate/methionine/tyrosine aminotransferase
VNAAAGESPNAAPALQASFDDLYTATYEILDAAKADRDLVKLYKGSHASPTPHPVVADFGEFFYRRRRGLIGYVCQAVNPDGEPTLADLDAWDRDYIPRVGVRDVFELLAATVRRPQESTADVLTYLATRTHRLSGYRGGSSGFDDEARAFAAAHFRDAGISVAASQVVISTGGAKGVFMAFCGGLMCRRRHDELRHVGGLMLAPTGYYQSLRLIPPLFGGSIHVADSLTGATVRAWLADTAGHANRCIYVPLVNNADGRVLTRDRACAIAAAVLEHNASYPGRPVYVLADDVYTGSYLTSGITGQPIGAITGEDLGEPALGRMSDWTLSVITPSKTFALPTARIAFAATTSPALHAAVAHYRTVLSQGRVPQIDELTAAGAICWTPQSWIDGWNGRYRAALTGMQNALQSINAAAGFDAFTIEAPEGGWYLPLRVSSRLIPQAASGVDAFAVLLHYGGNDRDSGVALLPGELFGYGAYGQGQPAGLGRDRPHELLLRGTLAADERDLGRFTARLREATTALLSPAGPEIIQAALKRARQVADVDEILATRRY